MQPPGGGGGKEGRKEGRKLTAANTTPLIKSARPQQSKADSDQVSAEVPLMSTCGSEHCWHCSRAHATRLDRTKSCCVSLSHERLDRATCECAAQPHPFVFTVIPEGKPQCTDATVYAVGMHAVDGSPCQSPSRCLPFPLLSPGARAAKKRHESSRSV